MPPVCCHYLYSWDFSFGDYQEASHSPGEGLPGPAFSGFCGVMVLLCFCLTDDWSIAGSLESHLTAGFSADNLVSVRGSSSPELYQKWKVSEYQWPNRSPLWGRGRRDESSAANRRQQPAASCHAHHTCSPVSFW